MADPEGFDWLADLAYAEMKRQGLSIQGLADRTDGWASREQLSYWFNGSRRLGSDGVAAVFWALNIKVGNRPPKKPG